MRSARPCCPSRRPGSVFDAKLAVAAEPSPHLGEMDILALFGFLAASFAAAGSGALFPPGSWYGTLARPRWCPPNRLFAPAWTVLFLMIAVAGWLVWREVGVGSVFGIYAAQLALNAAWSGIFFGLRRP